MHSRCCWPPDRPAPGSAEAIGDLVPQAGAAQRLLHPVALVGLRSLAATARTQPQAGCRVVEHRHRRERVRLLEDHADRATHRHHVHRRVVYVNVVEQHPALGVRAGDLLVHAVDASHERRLATARGPDDRGHLVGREFEVDALDLFGRAVERAQLLKRYAQGGLGRGGSAGGRRRGVGRRGPGRRGDRARRDGAGRGRARRPRAVVQLRSVLWLGVSHRRGGSV